MPSTKPQLQAVPASSASTKRKDLPGEEEDGESSGSDSESDSVGTCMLCKTYRLIPLSIPAEHGQR